MALSSPQTLGGGAGPSGPGLCFCSTAAPDFPEHPVYSTSRRSHTGLPVPPSVSFRSSALETRHLPTVWESLLASGEGNPVWFLSKNFRLKSRLNARCVHCLPVFMSQRSCVIPGVSQYLVLGWQEMFVELVSEPGLGFWYPAGHSPSPSTSVTIDTPPPWS